MSASESSQILDYLNESLVTSYMVSKTINDEGENCCGTSRYAIDAGRLSPQDTARLFGCATDAASPDLDMTCGLLTTAEGLEDQAVADALATARDALLDLRGKVEAALLAEGVPVVPAGTEPMDVLVSLVTYIDDQTSQHRLLEGALLAPATLNSDGTLSVPSGFPDTIGPWVPRDHLEHRVKSGDDALTFGSASDFSKFLRGMQAEGLKKRVGDSWGAYLDYCDAMRDAVIATDPEGIDGLPVRGYSDERYESPCLVTDACYVFPSDVIDAAKGIRGLYGSISASVGRGHNDDLELFDRLIDASADVAPDVRPISCGERDFACAHGGTMSEEYPLADNQRDALHVLGGMDVGDVLAVSGPPGTGKTTLLQSIVADELVRAALEGDVPPVIVGTSTNNQAVTNIIDSFGSVKVPKGKGSCLNHRWLLDAASLEKGRGVPLQSLGTYFPSQAKADKAKSAGYLVGQPKMEGVYQEYSSEGYVRRARAALLDYAEVFLGQRPTSCSDAKERLRERLSRIDALRRELVSSFGGSSSVDELARIAVLLDEAITPHDRTADEVLSRRAEQALFKLRSKGPWTLEALDQVLDTVVRPAEFWLACHVFECRWLEVCENGPAGERECVPDRLISEGSRWMTSPKARDVYYHQLACVTPCLVMTLYQVPKYFTKRVSKDVEGHMLGFVDLLIIDEAGQVDSSVGAAAFALAKRALVVGDVNQLPPVWGIEPEDDEGLAGDANVSPDAWRRMSASGLTSSRPSCVMRAAMEACAVGSDYEDGGTRHVEGGLFLPEHRRCYDEIVEYCNELVYSGRLKPMRGSFFADEKNVLLDVLPPFGRVPVSGKSSTAGGSRTNEQEATAVATWIQENFQTLWDRYGGADGKVNAAEVIGVVTPFRAQAGLIRSKLAGWDHARDVTCGTAHALQGAERKIVLFSLVYAGSDNPGFVNDNPQLMNVAVSRAKDSFVVFGDSAILDRPSGASEKTSTSLLGSHSRGHEVPLAVSVPLKGEALSATRLQAKLSEAGPFAGRGIEALKSGRNLIAYLHEKGLIAKGESGDWLPTDAGSRMGITVQSGRDKNGREYSYPVYPPKAQDAIAHMLEEGLGSDR